MRTPDFELHSPCPNCRTIALHFLRDGVSDGSGINRLIGRGCRTCGCQWHEKMTDRKELHAYPSAV